jgi:hypothetical protein
MRPGDVIALPAKAAQRLEGADLRHPRRPGEHPIRIRSVELGGERRVVRGRRRDDLLVDNRHAELGRLLLGEIDFAARQRDRHGGEAEPDRILRGVFYESERGAAVVGRRIRGGAELQRVGRRIDFLGTDAAGEQQRHIGALGFGDHRRIGRREARIDHQDHIVLRQQLLGVGRRA